MNLNDPRWELIRRCHDGDATPEDFSQLESQLSDDEAFRRDYVRYVNVDVALATSAAGPEAGFMPDGEAIPLEGDGQNFVAGHALDGFVSQRSDREAIRGNLAATVAAWMRRPLAAAAAGLVIGLLSASMVFAYVVPRPVVKPITLLHDSFEDISWNGSAGFPANAGEWSGDPAVVSGAEGEAHPVHGTRMLKTGPATNDLFNRLFYAVDLRQNPLPAGVRQVRLGASFRPVSTANRSRYLLRAAVFSQRLDEIEPRWMTDQWSELDERALARAARAFPLLPGSDGWQTVSITVDVPPGASVLIVSLWTATMDGKIENRTPHYVDDVRLSGILQEQTP